MSFQPPYPVPEQRQAYTIFGDQTEAEKRNGRIGCLMLHGFMGSPVSSRDMATYLAEHGITVHCPLLPGHGHLPEKLHNYTLNDWLAEAEEALHYLQEKVDHLFVMGHSMGAILAAKLAYEHQPISGLIMLAPLYDVPDKRIKLVRFVRFVVPWFYPLKRKDIDHKPFLHRVTDYDPTIDIHDPSLKDWLMLATRIPLSATWQMVKTAAMGRRIWPKLEVPTIVLQGESDAVVSLTNTQMLFNTIPIQDKRMETFPNTGHHLMRPMEPVHQRVWRLIYEFVEAKTAVLPAMWGE